MSKALYLFLSKFLPSCRDVSRLVSESCERKLTLKERMGIKFKRMLCFYTDRYVTHIEMMNKELKAQGDQCSEKAVSECMSEERKAKLKEMMNKTGD